MDRLHLHEKLMRIASIDIGTNTILMLVTDFTDAGVPVVVSDELVVARLGKGVDAERKILPETFERCENFLRGYREQAEALHADRIIVTATSALRDAANRDEFIAAMRKSAGVEIELISGDDEALLTFQGALCGFAFATDVAAVLDIGGGSTEFIIGDRNAVHAKASIDIGSVRITERFLHHSPPTEDELEAARGFIISTIKAYPRIDASRTTFFGVAGTVTTLAALELRLPVYDANKISGFHLTRSNIDAHFAQLKQMTAKQIRSHLSVDPGRADIILAGVLILREVMADQGMDEIIVSERGLRFGVAMREWGRSRI